MPYMGTNLSPFGLELRLTAELRAAVPLCAHGRQREFDIDIPSSGSPFTDRKAAALAEIARENDKSPKVVGQVRHIK